MIPEIGLFSLIIALAFSLLLTVVPTLGLCLHKNHWVATTRYYVLGQFLAIGLAFLSLTCCFILDDFSVLYVFSNSSIKLPWFYKLCATWGGHEGSMLLWVTILSFWMQLVSIFSKNIDDALRNRVLIVLGAVSLGLILFILSTSNPFLRQFQVLDSMGRDLNPLLQDPGFLFHPPMLYMGYVGFSVAFAFAIAALWLGRIEVAWAKWTRPWTLAAWCCLTAGITLGSWWAYRELGWGGWWFWDPVENASFMPWLVGTALIHSLAVNEKRKLFQIWTLFLAITAFSLSLVGTFLVRSGVLTSVHAFAVDPARGIYILAFLFIIIGGALLLFALRINTLQLIQPPSIVSRESILLLNNIFLMVATMTILLGTLYPFIIDALGLGKLSVGAPYFNRVFVPLMLPVLFLMGIGVHTKWNKDAVKRIFQGLNKLLCVSFILPSISFFYGYQNLTILAYVALAFATWIILSTLKAFLNKVRDRKRITSGFLGMMLAHSGIAVTVVGITISSIYGFQDDVKIYPGAKINIHNYTVQFVNEKSIIGPNYHGTQAHFLIINKDYQNDIYPEKRIYDSSRMPMTESAIDVTIFRDIYIALGDPLDNGAWIVRVYFKPLIRWIWGGGFIILFGGAVALMDLRYFLKRKEVNTTLEVGI